MASVSVAVAYLVLKVIALGWSTGTVQAGAPFPVSATVGGAVTPPPEIVILPVTVPIAVGSNCTYMSVPANVGDVYSTFMELLNVVPSRDTM